MNFTIFTGEFLSASEIREGFFTDENNFFLNPPCISCRHQSMSCSCLFLALSNTS